MPERRLQKARASLPEGYQFGDSASLAQAMPRLLSAVEWARIEVSHDAIRVTLPSMETPPFPFRPRQTVEIPSDLCLPCSVDMDLPRHWNVIEGEHDSDAERHKTIEGHQQSDEWAV